jgi:hypothetical protein
VRRGGVSECKGANRPTACGKVERLNQITEYGVRSAERERSSREAARLARSANPTRCRGRNRACLETLLNLYNVMQDFAAQYQVSRGGENLGAYDLAAVRQMILSGTLSPSDLVWTQGMAEWQPVSTVLPELGTNLTTPPRPVVQDSERDRLRAIAVNHRALIWLFLPAVLLSCSSATLVIRAGFDRVSSDEILVGLVVFMLEIILCVKVYRLSRALKTSIFYSIVLVISIFIPCLSLFILLSLSSEANSALRRAGIRVGLLGADPDRLP